MLSKGETRRVKELHTKKSRKEKDSFIAEGPKIVGEILHSELNITEIYGTGEWLIQNEGIIHKKKITFREISSAELSSISAVRSPNLVLAVCRRPHYDPWVIDKDRSLFLFLDQIADPGNMGTIIRMAEWFGLGQVFCSPGCAEVFSPKVVQSSMGSIARVKVFHLSLVQLKKLLPGTEICGAALQGENIFTAAIPGKKLVVIGNESHGISAENIALLTRRLTIPGSAANRAESLNAASAASILVSELYRKENRDKF